MFKYKALHVATQACKKAIKIIVYKKQKKRTINKTSRQINVVYQSLFLFIEGLSARLKGYTCCEIIISA